METDSVRTNPTCRQALFALALATAVPLVFFATVASREPSWQPATAAASISFLSSRVKAIEFKAYVLTPPTLELLPTPEGEVLCVFRIENAEGLQIRGSNESAMALEEIAAKIMSATGQDLRGQLVPVSGKLTNPSLKGVKRLFLSSSGELFLHIHYL